MIRTIEAHAQSAPDALGRDFIDPRVLAVMAAVPRHEFVSGWYEDQAYDDRPLPIGHGQTISQPFIVALMTDMAASAPTTSCSRSARARAIRRPCSPIWCGPSIPSRSSPSWPKRADERLRRLGYGNVHAYTGDGYYGVPETAPFDAIVVTAAARRCRRR